MTTKEIAASPRRKKNTARPGVQENPLARKQSAVLYVAEAAPARSRGAAGGRVRAPETAVRRQAAAGKARADVDPLFDIVPEATRSGGARVRSKIEGQARKKTSGKSKQGKAAGSGKGKRGGNGLTIALTAAILLFAAVGVWRVQEYRAFAEMKQAVSTQTFYAGTTVDGIDVSRMTLEEALAYWANSVEPAYRSVGVTLDDGTQATSEQLGYTSDYETVLSGAWSAGRSGTLLERYNSLSERAQSPVSYTVTRSAYSGEALAAYAQSLAAQIDTQARDASVKSFDTDSYAFEFEAEQVGYTLNQSALIDALKTALDAGGGSVKLEIDAQTPAVTLENVQAQYGMISYAVTDASSSSSNRLGNIKLALSLINGTALEPGESFSFNGTVGERTTARGFKVATAYSSGEVTEQVGGGICQVSTTLFNAVVKANLTINERHPHSLTVAYVDLGKDAAVNWGSQDLRFTNSSSDRVYICCYLTSDKRVRIGVFGKLLPDGQTITLEGRKTGTISYETVYNMNFALPTGTTKVTQSGKNGYTATTDKVTWDANGTEIARTELCKSSYRARSEIIEYGP